MCDMEKLKQTAASNLTVVMLVDHFMQAQKEVNVCRINSLKSFVFVLQMFSEDFHVTFKFNVFLTKVFSCFVPHL